MSDVIVMEIELKGPMEPYQILLEPYAVVVPGEVYIHTTLRRQFKVDDALFFTPTSLLSLKFCITATVFPAVSVCFVRCGTTAEPSSTFNGRKMTVTGTR